MCYSKSRRTRHAGCLKYAMRLFIVLGLLILIGFLGMNMYVLTNKNAASDLPTPLKEVSLGARPTPLLRSEEDDTMSAPPEEFMNVIGRYIDAYDVLPSRKSESFISFKEFVSCLEARLHLDVANQRELPFPPEGAYSSIPFMITVLSVDLRDAKASLCYHRVPIRRLLYVSNGDAPEIRLLLDGLEHVFKGWTRRLLIHRHPDGIGAAGALNVGLREALNFPFDEVPFVHVCDSGARLSSGPFRTSLAEMYSFTRKDKDLLRRLRPSEEELTNGEGRDRVHQPAPTPAQFPFRTPPNGVVFEGGWAKLSTSALCPRGVLNNPYAATTLFRGHEGLALGDSVVPAASFFLSRLAILVVGYFDENTFPGGFELQDYRWRARLLGFTVRTLDAWGVVAQFHDDIMFSLFAPHDVAEGAGEGPGSSSSLRAIARLSPPARAFSAMMRGSFTRGVFCAYLKWKWGVMQPVEFESADPPRLPYMAEPRPDGLPTMRMDTWVLDWKRVVHIQRYLSGQTQSTDGLRYNSKLLKSFI